MSKKKNEQRVEKKYSGVFKFFAGFLALIMIVTTFTIAFGSNGSKPEYNKPETSKEAEKKAASVSVSVLSPEGETLAEQTDIVVSTTALEFVERVLSEADIEFQTASGKIKKVGDIESEESEGWILSVNGEVPQMSAATVFLKDDDTVSVSWGNLAEAYPEPVEEESAEEESPVEE